MKRSPLASSALFLSLLAGCAAAPPPAPAPPPVEEPAPEPKGPQREPPPEAGPAKESRFPKVSWSELPNGLKLAVIPQKGLPVVHARVVVLGGKSADGEKPGLAGLTGQLLKEGGAGKLSSRDLISRVESMGGDLSIASGFDDIEVLLTLTRDHLDEGLDLLGAMVEKPQLSPGEFDKLQKREAEAAADSAKTKGLWGTSMVLYRDLFMLPSEHHPYASFAATATELRKLKVDDCRAFHKSFFVPKNTFVIVAGDTTPDAARAAVEKSFGAWKGGEAPVISFTDPNRPAGRKITLVDRPKSSQSEVLVGFLGPEVNDKGYTAFTVASQVLGGGVSGRLFADLREKQSLAYSTRSFYHEYAHGPVVFTAQAGTRTAKTGLALQGLLENLDRIVTTAPDDEEVRAATRFLGDTFAMRRETPASLAFELEHLHLQGLPDDHHDHYRKELFEITGAFASKAISDHVKPGHEIIVVAGDAAIVGPMLAHFGEVKVVDPTRDFARERTLPMDASAPLEAPAPPEKKPEGGDEKKP